MNILLRKTLSLLTPVILLFCTALVVQSCYVGRFFWWNFADLNDYRKFPALSVEKAGDIAELPYHPVDSIKLPDEYDPQGTLSLNSFLRDHETVAYLIIKNDTLIFENYFDDYTAGSIVPSFSVSKVFVSALTGIAIGDGYIEEVKEPVSKYVPIPDDPGYREITLENLLNMRSGLDFEEAYKTPFASMPKYYYGRHLKRYIRKLEVTEEPGTRYEYMSVNTLLLSLALEKATGMKITEYMEEKIWKPLGMEYDATWSIDSKKSNTVKSFCCLNARARDFARFGLLYLNRGNWNGHQVIPAGWVERSTTVMNDSRDSQGYHYTYQWRVAEGRGYFAKGLLGQYIMVFPSENAVVVRLGRKYADIDWFGFTGQLLEEL